MRPIWSATYMAMFWRRLYPQNIHNSAAFDDVYDKVTEQFLEIEAVIADSTYKTLHICKKVFDDGGILSTAYKRPQTMKGGHKWYEYVYDEHYDCIICPEYQNLYALRKQTMERVLADAKEKHAMRYTQYRGLAQVSK